MICPKCKFAELKETILFSSIETEECNTCTVGDYIREAMFEEFTKYKYIDEKNTIEIKVRTAGSIQYFIQSIEI